MQDQKDSNGDKKDLRMKYSEAYKSMRDNPIKLVIMNILIAFCFILLILWNLFSPIIAIGISFVAGIFIGPIIYVWILLIYRGLAASNSNSK